MSSGQVRSPVRSNSPPTACATACCAGAASRSCSAVKVLAPGDLGAIRGLDRERHPQVRRQLVQVERIDGHQNAGAAAQFALQCVQHRFTVRIDPCHHRACGVGGGNEVAAQVLRQRADERGDELLAQRGHLPRELVATQARENVDRHMHRDAVVGGTGLEPIGQGQRDITRLPGVRPFRVTGVVGPQQVVAGECQQVRCLVALLLPPCVEVPRGHDIRRDAGVVERVDVVVTDQQVAAAGAVLQLLEFRAQKRVVAEEVMAGLPLPLDESVPDE